MASGSTEVAPASASKAAATVAVHRVRIVLSTSNTGPVKFTPGARAVRCSRSLARTAEAASTAGGGPLIVSALIVRGETVDEKDERVDLGHDAQILVAVIHVGHLTNRADLKVEEPVNNPWVAKTGSHHFNENDEVYAVGAATQKAGDRPRLFADGFTVSLK
jgi:hypothetical protein